MLIELGVLFEALIMDLEKGDQRLPSYLALNPEGRVPALMVDGKIYTQCGALLMLLAERHPDRSFDRAPDHPDRGLYLQWMVWLANTLQPTFRTRTYADGASSPEAAAEIKAAARAQTGEHFDYLDAHFADGRPYLLGDAISAADFHLTMMLRWARKNPLPASYWANLDRYQSAMRQMPSLREVHRREGLEDWIYDAPATVLKP